jgi:hypothetical protein
MTEHMATETDRVRRILDKEAHNYDRQMGFSSGPCSRAGASGPARGPEARCSSSRTGPRPSLPVRSVQRLIDPLAIGFGADHIARDPLAYLADVGFAVDRVERLKWGIVERVLARRPA